MKYGLNMMGVCDAQRRFIWVECRFPGASSDYYVFDDSDLKQKIEGPGFLRPGLCMLETMHISIHRTCVLLGAMCHLDPRMHSTFSILN